MSEDTSKPKSIDGSIPDPEVKADKTKSKARRYLTSKYKLEILKKVDACKDRPGEVGALLRREGLYSSHLSAWKRERKEGRLTGAKDTPRGPKPEFSEIEAENLELKREIGELRTQRDQALLLIEAQKKIAEIFAVGQKVNPPKTGREKP